MKDMAKFLKEAQSNLANAESKSRGRCHESQNVMGLADERVRILTSLVDVLQRCVGQMESREDVRIDLSWAKAEQARRRVSHGLKRLSGFVNLTNYLKSDTDLHNDALDKKMRVDDYNRGNRMKGLEGINQMKLEVLELQQQLRRLTGMPVQAPGPQAMTRNTHYAAVPQPDDTTIPLRIQMV